MKRFLIVFFGLCLLLTGCSGMNIRELYCLPEAPEDHYDLQAALGEDISQGLQYLAPAAGSRRQPVQLTDLDGDGVDEAVAFFRSTSDGAVKTYIYQNQEGSYQRSAVIDCAGTAVGSVDYLDLDNSGDLELLISCQLSETVTQALQICRYVGGEAATLATVSCNRYRVSDLEEDGMGELICFSDNGAEGCGVGLYGFSDGQVELKKELKLRGSYSGILGVDEVVLEDEEKALAIASALGDSQLVYDVITLREGAYTLISTDALVSDMKSVGALYPMDMDQDGRTEFPQLRELPSYGEGTTRQSVAVWQSLDSRGESFDKVTTYHNSTQGWYLLLPETWTDEITVKETSTATPVSSVEETVFYRLDPQGKAGEEILRVYTLKGTVRQSYPEEHGLTVLYSDTDMVCAVEIPEGAEEWDGSITVSQISERFRLMETDTE